MPRGRAPHALALVATCALACAGCDRAPLDVECPPGTAGALVVSELRGRQSGGDDAMGQWIEIYNPGDAAASIAGLRVRLTKLDGSGEAQILVRDAALSVPAHGYAVLGRFTPGDLPPNADYGYAQDYAGDLYPSGVVELASCGNVIDTAIYDGLPITGTLALDGAAPPDATANDSSAGWCIDPTSAGTPRQGNPPCP